jgi:hypothetical protein
MAQQFHYHGVSTRYPNINMELIITTSYADATGTIYVGAYRYPVKGTFSGGTFSATATYNVGPAFFSAFVNGGLSGGALGVGTITASTTVAFNGPPLNLTFDLFPSGRSAAARPAAPSPPPPPPALPASLHLNGVVSFGYTKAWLTLNFTLRGSSYVVNGTMFVNQIRPSLVQRTLTISGVLTPGVQGQLAVSGAFPGDNPNFSAALNGRRFEGLITGIPSLSITRLYVGAS